jgi:uncharacterized membrane protein YedE/YeeE
MHNLTPVASLLGGLLIGVAAGAMLLFDGKVAGISGVVDGLLHPMRGEWRWRACFVGGLLAGGVVLRLLDPGAYAFTIARSPAAIVTAGLLVGFGTRLGNGCTSGHGVCGVSRLSGRSLWATIIFVASGAVTVFLLNHIRSLAS